jgi:hypothetical protein
MESVMEKTTGWGLSPPPIYSGQEEARNVLVGPAAAGCSGGPHEARFSATFWLPIGTDLRFI